jgi:hypothetical protein
VKQKSVAWSATPASVETLNKTVSYQLVYAFIRSPYTYPDFASNGLHSWITMPILAGVPLQSPPDELRCGTDAGIPGKILRNETPCGKHAIGIERLTDS